MDYAKFKNLISSGENDRVDLKLDCQAFSSSQSANAELAKDICAMANNGNVASYLIIGVSNDRRVFKSVRNKNLTNDKLQDFAKKAVFPPPKVKLVREKWTTGDKSHRGKEFVIIQIGPQARKAFRLARDFISYPDKVCYRRNEVWLRRGATTDIATPEEISQLVRGRRPESHEQLGPNVKYEQVLRDHRDSLIVKDLEECVQEAGGSTYDTRIVVPIRYRRFVWRFVLVPECTEKFAVWGAVALNWQYEHGILILSLGTVSKHAFHSQVRMHFEDNWGYFTSYEVPNSLLLEPRNSFPANTERGALVTVTLPHVKDTVSLRNRVLAMLDRLETNDDAYEEVNYARETINKNLRRWVRQGWLFPTGRYYMGGHPQRRELGSNEVFGTHYGRQILRREWPKGDIEEVKRVLNLSSGKSRASTK